MTNQIEKPYTKMKSNGARRALAFMLALAMLLCIPVMPGMAGAEVHGAGNTITIGTASSSPDYTWASASAIHEKLDNGDVLQILDMPDSPTIIDLGSKAVTVSGQGIDTVLTNVAIKTSASAMTFQALNIYAGECSNRGLHTVAPITISAIGGVKIHGGKHYDGGYGIYANENITINGDVTATGGDGIRNGGRGIYAAKDITINGDVMATGGDSVNKGEGGDGFCTQKNITINGDIIATGGMEQGSVTGKGGAGILVFQKADIVVEGNVTAIGGEGYSNVGGKGMEMDEGTLIFGGTAVVTGGCGEKQGGYGLLIVGVNHSTISGSSMIATGGSSPKRAGSGIYGGKSDLTINGDQITFKGGDGGGEHGGFGALMTGVKNLNLNCKLKALGGNINAGERGGKAISRANSTLLPLNIVLQSTKAGLILKDGQNAATDSSNQHNSDLYVSRGAAWTGLDWQLKKDESGNDAEDVLINGSKASDPAINVRTGNYDMLYISLDGTTITDTHTEVNNNKISEVITIGNAPTNVPHYNWSKAPEIYKSLDGVKVIQLLDSPAMTTNINTSGYALTISGQGIGTIISGASIKTSASALTLQALNLYAGSFTGDGAPGINAANKIAISTVGDVKIAGGNGKTSGGHGIKSEKGDISLNGDQLTVAGGSSDNASNAYGLGIYIPDKKAIYLNCQLTVSGGDVTPGAVGGKAIAAASTSPASPASIVFVSSKAGLNLKDGLNASDGQIAEYFNGVIELSRDAAIPSELVWKLNNTSALSGGAITDQLIHVFTNQTMLNISLGKKNDEIPSRGGNGSVASYTIKSEAGTGGKIDPSGSITVTSGTSKTFTITADEGYKIKDVTVDGTSVGAKSTYIFNDIKQNHTIKVTFEEGEVETALPFTDIENHWAKDAILFVYEQELMNGTGGTLFSPDDSMTRGMLVTVLGRYYESVHSMGITGYTDPVFSDVTGNYYLTYINWAADKGIVNGIGDSKFAPDAPVTRQEAAKIIYGFIKEMNLKIASTKQAHLAFTDEASIAAWAKAFVKEMQDLGLIEGRTDGSFDPTGKITRAEAATIMQRMIKAS